MKSLLVSQKAQKPRFKESAYLKAQSYRVHFVRQHFAHFLSLILRHEEWRRYEGEWSSRLPRKQNGEKDQIFVLQFIAGSLRTGQNC